MQLKLALLLDTLQVFELDVTCVAVGAFAEQFSS